MAYIPVDIDKSIERECKRRRYSDKTIKTYLYCIHRFLKFTGKTLDKISKKDVRKFLFDLSEKNMAGNTLNVYHMALRFLFEDVLDKRIWIDIHYSKVPEKIQRSLTKQELKRLFNAVNNHKHRLMAEFLYSAGLRASELVNIRVKDINLKEGYGFVRNGKGGKDRIIIIADALKDKLSRLIEEGDLTREDYIFNSNRDRKYSISSLQKVIKKAAEDSDIDDWKEIHPHTLRHSFATHLIENNYSVSDVQASLGHKSPETSMIYVHSSGKMIGIKSPFDFL
ncbi:MAG: tyrosine-type recombinase/integrase [Nanoarchaeota archaeon]|nr:tyrosine-type recombinase/integrase [Nanoarchaeota archaeon]MBU1004735.1 tyrosine-type recombinase/integrase [Nanoarchaeota archaeon]MBU1945692.1 tyrosine-type recombinase/integrase [Nanoarchaeota archaeon]